MTGYLKPHPKAYEVVIEAMASEPGDVGFLDDQPASVCAAEAAGVVGVVRSEPTFPQQIRAA